MFNTTCTYTTFIIILISADVADRSFQIKAYRCFSIFFVKTIFNNLSIARSITQFHRNCLKKLFLSLCIPSYKAGVTIVLYLEHLRCPSFSTHLWLIPTFKSIYETIILYLWGVTYFIKLYNSRGCHTGYNFTGYNNDY